MNVENGTKSSLKWMPRSVPFILIYILMERYSTTSTTNIMVVYLHEELGFDMDISTALYHISELLTYVFPTFAAIIADGYAGLYKTLIWVSFTFAISCYVMAAGAVEQWGLPSIPLTLFGMFLFISGGSIRSGLATFGADQYQLPEQLPQFRNFFFFQMIFVKIGALLGRFFGPVLREDVKCLGKNNCYPLAFGFPAFVICMGIIMMICARKFFVHKPLNGNMIGKVFGCIFTGIKGKLTSKTTKNHFLDHSEPKYGAMLVNDTKSIMRVMAVLGGISIYYSCFLQQNSRWIFQASQMNGDLGFYTLKHDQIIFFNPLSALFLTPLSNYVLFPLLAKCGIKSLVHRITVGGFICCLGFVFATIIEFQIKANYISMLWMLPQYICASLSEIFVLLSSINFAYEFGPAGMKSVMTAMVYLTVALGDSLIPIVSGLKIFKSQAYEFIFFGSLLFVNMIVFCVIVSRLDFKKSEEISNEESEK